MFFHPPLSEGHLIKRYKRFFADLETPDGIITVHVPNTGSLKGCLEPGSPCLYAVSTDPKRKLKGTLHFIQTPTTWVGVNTALPNKLVEELILERKVEHWKPYEFHRMEVKINPKSRIDVMLAKTREDLDTQTHGHFIEIKNVTMNENDCALFPDAVTERGQKHLVELMKLKDEGHGAEICFVVQRTDCSHFAPCAAIDPQYAELLKKAQDHGVRVTALACQIEKNRGVTLSAAPLKIKL